MTHLSPFRTAADVLKALDLPLEERFKLWSSLTNDLSTQGTFEITITIGLNTQTPRISFMPSAIAEKPRRKPRRSHA